MSTPITAILSKCHRLRRLIRDVQAEIDLGPRVQKIQQAKLTQEEQGHKEVYETIKKLKLKQKEDEGSLKAVDQQIGKLQTRAMEVTTMREMEATRSEIAQATAKKNNFEEAILVAMTDIEGRTTNLPNVEKQWAEAQADFARMQVEGKERLVRLQTELASAKEELGKAEQTIPAQARPTYNSLVKAHGAEAMSAVRDRVCMSCRSTMPDQKHIELVNGAFLTCSNCGRALYPAEG